MPGPVPLGLVLVTTLSDGVDVDVRRRAGWLPRDHDELESWLSGHRKRVEAKGEQAALHPYSSNSSNGLIPIPLCACTFIR